MKPGRAGTMTHDYKPHGTTMLFAALNILDGHCQRNTLAWDRRAVQRSLMCNVSYLRHCFRNVIQQAVWLYFRFALSYRDVEDMLAARGIDVSYETVRRWALKFGSIIARKLRQGPPRPDGRWHLDEVFVSINGRQLYVWRAVNSEGEVLDILVQPGETARQRSS